MSFAPWALALALGATLPDDAIFAFVMVDRFADGAPNLPDVVPGHPRRFQGGDLVGLRARLPYLKALGVTHIWMTPVARQVPGLVGDGAEATAAYHGYWPLDLRGVDPHFGNETDLREMVGAARAQGIGVVLDVVVNHFGYGAPDPERLLRQRCGTSEVDACLFGLPDLETETPRVREIVVERTARWARDFDLAGFRLDAFKHVTPDVFREIRHAVQGARPSFFTLAEHWGASPTDGVVRQIVDAGAADAVLDFSLMGLARDWVAGRMRTAAFVHHLVARDEAQRAAPPMLAFLDNHDVETWAHAVGSRAVLGAPLLLLDRAVPVITWGTELGRLGGAADPDNRTAMSWDEVARAEHDSSSPLHAWRGLVGQRRAHPVLQRGALRIVARDDKPAGDSGFIVLERRSADASVLAALARGRRVLHAEPTPAGTRILDVVATRGGRAVLQQGSIVVDVPADGFVSVVLAPPETSPATRPRGSSSSR